MAVQNPSALLLKFFSLRKR